MEPSTPTPTLPSPLHLLTLRPKAGRLFCLSPSSSFDNPAGPGGGGSFQPGSPGPLLTFPFVCSQLGGAPETVWGTTEGINLVTEKKGEDTCLEPTGYSHPSPQTLPRALGASVLASWEPHLAGPVASVLCVGSIRLYSFLVDTIKDLEAFYFS